MSEMPSGKDERWQWADIDQELENRGRDKPWRSSSWSLVRSLLAHVSIEVVEECLARDNKAPSYKSHIEDIQAIIREKRS